MDLLGTAWKLLLLRGVIGVLFGIVAIAWPISTVVALVVLWGVWALVDGIGLATEALRQGTTGERLLAGVMALVAVLAGLYAIFHPGATAVVLTWIVGIWLLVRGLFEVVRAFARSLPGSTRAMLVVSALVDFLLGGIFVAHPGKSAIGVTTLLGVVAVVWGGVLIVLALVVRSQAHDLDDHVSPAPA
jgi:uncharacterized membrane protein HdeD (DUF308 family)